MPAPPLWARGSQVLPTTAGTCPLITSPASQSHMICYIYTPSQEGEVDAWCLARGERRIKRCWSQLCPPSARCQESAAYSFSCPLGQGFLLLEVSALIKHVGEVAGVLLTHSQRRGHAGLPAGWQQHGEGLVGRLPMHPEAVDAGVLRVAPVSQDPQLHHLVCGHFRVLGGEGREECQSLRPHWQQAGGEMPHLGPDAPLPWGLCRHLDFRAPVFRLWGRVSSWWAKEPQGLQRSYRDHPPRATRKWPCS